MSAITIPSAFAARMQRLLQNEYEDFLSAYGSERYYGLRLNPLKPCDEGFSFLAERIPWEPNGYYYDPEGTPGKHPLHEAGAYYIQEPSAMSAVAVLDPQPGERILDLCAAPGGKSTQIAGRMMGKGLLVSNEIVPSRAQILAQNIERMGIRNAVVLNESPDRLSAHFPAFFDRILVDAPCSGEGMFRKGEAALSEWSEENVRMCVKRQLDILEEAASMLRPGGTMVYSTCTFSPAENEGCMYRFLRKHPEFSLAESPVAVHFSRGNPAWALDESAYTSEDDGADAALLSTLTKTMRLWPHKLRGEGHFVTLLHKEGSLNDSYETSAESTGKSSALKAAKNKSGKGTAALSEDALLSFGLCSIAARELLASGRVISFGENIYLLPAEMNSLDKLKVVRPGLWVGTAKKDRIEPAHSLALSLRSGEVTRYYEMRDEETLRYIHGETLSAPADLTGWILMLSHGISVGFGKASGGTIKNHYPKGLRK